MIQAEIMLDTLIAELPTETHERELLEAWSSLAQRLGLALEPGGEMIVAIARDVTLYSARQLEPAWGGGWKWDLSKSAVRTVCGTALLAAVFASGGLATLPPLVLPAVLPLMFDLKRVRLRRSEERVLEIMNAKPSFLDRIGQPAELFATLPDWVKNSMSLVEFEEFLDHVVEAGRAKKQGQHYEILPNGETVLRLTLN
jgi:hypothetical protein